MGTRLDYDTLRSWHPRWRLHHRPSGWWAIRHERVSDAAWSAGVRSAVLADTLDELHWTLSRQEVLRGEHAGC